MINSVVSCNISSPNRVEYNKSPEKQTALSNELSNNKVTKSPWCFRAAHGLRVYAISLHHKSAPEGRELAQRMRNFFHQHHTKNSPASTEQVRELFNEVFEANMRMNIKAGLVCGDNITDDIKMRVLRATLWIMNDENVKNASAALGVEKMNVLKQKGLIDENGGPMRGISFYDSRFFFQHREMSEILQEIGREFAEKHGLSDPFKRVSEGGCLENHSLNNRFYMNWVLPWNVGFIPVQGFAFFKNHYENTATFSGGDFGDGRTIPLDEFYGFLDLTSHDAAIRSLIEFIKMHNLMTLFEIGDNTEEAREQLPHTAIDRAYEAHDVYLNADSLVGMSVEG